MSSEEEIRARQIIDRLHHQPPDPVSYALVRWVLALTDRKDEAVEKGWALLGR